MKTRPRRLTILALLIILLVFPVAVQAGSLVGASFVIRADPEREVSPSIAYNSQRQQYLVVWYNDRPGNDDIRAQRVRSNGTLVGGPFYISAGAAERRYPDVAYNSKHDQYLVVWEHYEAAQGYSIKGRRVSGTGQVLDATDIDIRSWSNLYTPVKPAVDYAYTSDCYLVVWAETWHPMPITYSIEGQVVTDTGALDGGQFSISQGSDSREEPDLSYNRHANRYLVVWQQKAGALYAIHGQQVQGGGGAYLGDITIFWTTASGTSPAVASIPTTSTNDKFLVVFELMYTPPNDRHIYGRMVREDGTVGAGLYISSVGGVDESTPAVAGNEHNRQYFVAWRHPQGVVDQPIKGRAISDTGVPVGQVAEFSAPAAYNPAVVAGAYGDFLVAWQNQPVFAIDQNIYGQLWGNRVYLPVVKK